MELCSRLVALIDSCLNKNKGNIIPENSELDESMHSAVELKPVAQRVCTNECDNSCPCTECSDSCPCYIEQNIANPLDVSYISQKVDEVLNMLEDVVEPTGVNNDGEKNGDDERMSLM